MTHSPSTPLAAKQAEHVQRLVELLRYIAQLQPQDALPDQVAEKDVLLDPELGDQLPGLTFPMRDTGEGAWVRLARIQLSNPPEVPAELGPWVALDPNKPLAGPVLRKRIDNPAAKRKKGAADEAGADDEKTYLWLRNFPQIEEAFGEWMTQWQAWLDEEEPRRRSAQVYEHLYRIFRDLTADGQSDTHEVVMGMAHALWRMPGGETNLLNRPLIMQRCELRMAEGAEAAMEVWPAAVPPVLELGKLGVGPAGEDAEAFWRKFQSDDLSLSPFEPQSWQHIAAGLAARLDASGSFLSDWTGTNLPDPTPRLTVLPWFSLFYKKRSLSPLLADLARLERAVLEANSLPASLVALVDRDSVLALPDQLPGFRGLETTGSAGENDAMLYFPLPYNEEQVQVAQRLEVSPGVVVQGPPGTGKSHTIANVVSHFLAHGKRVLVTAHSAAALAAVREKIPESLRDLTAALLTSDTDSLADFEKSVREIADRLATFQPESAARVIEDLTAQVEGQMSQLDEIDATLSQHMRPHHAIHQLHGHDATLMDLTRYHMEQADERPIWLGRVPEAAGRTKRGASGRRFPTIPASVDNTLIARLRQARLDAGPLFGQLFEPLCDISSLPREEDIREAIEAHRRLTELQAQVRDGQAKAKRNPLDPEAIWPLNQDVDQLGAIISQLQQAQRQADALDPSLRRPGGEENSNTVETCQQIIDLRNSLAVALGKIQIPEAALADEEFRQAVARGAAGESPLGGWMARMRKSKTTKPLLDAVRVDGLPVTSQDGWRRVEEHLKALAQAAQAPDDWARAMVAFGWHEEGQVAKGMALVSAQPVGPEAVFQRLDAVAKQAENHLQRDAWQHNLAPQIERALGELFVDPGAAGLATTPNKWARAPQPGDAISLRARPSASTEEDQPVRYTAPWGNWIQQTDAHRELVLSIAERSLTTWQALAQTSAYLDSFKQRCDELLANAKPMATLPSLPPLPVPPKTRQTVSAPPPTLLDRVRSFLTTEMWDEHSRSGASGWRTSITAHNPSVQLEQRLITWRSLLSGMERLVDAGKLAAEVAEQTLSCLVEAGFGDWVHALVKQPLGNLPNPKRGAAVVMPDDPLLPENWAELVTRAQVHAFLVGLDAPGQLSDLLARRREAVEGLAWALRELAAEKAWTHLAKTATPRQRQALGAYLSAVRAVGSGNGKRSTRHQQDARQAMAEAFSVVPCWIMPTARVSESMPSELGLFDLVVIDEASQSDISALPVLMRGQKVLVVGDDKQVSPSNFVQEDVILGHRRTLLAKQPFAPLMAPDKSIYDLFSGVLPNASIMLREHFRCVGPIIAWSNTHYYHDKMIPLRMPPAAERIEPPLVDLLVEDGRMEDDVNEAEAVVIAREIARIVKDPAMASKTIGVVTLPSKETQSLKIKDAIDQAISHQEYLHHKILVGPPARFQGSERDIMFVAMTWDGNSGGASDKPEFHQRFNVAMSRARDQMILVRSIPDTGLRGGTLMAQVARHFHEPTSDVRNNEHGRHRCNTDLERAIFDALAERGYDVQAQVGPRHARIDLVVEDRSGNRLAIECDGDLPAATLLQGDTWEMLWRAAMARERVLERAGWTFMRVAAATWYLDPAGTLDRIQARLEDCGVRPRSEQESHGRLTQAAQRHVRAGLASGAADTSPKSVPQPVMNTGRFQRRLNVTDTSQKG